MKIQMHYFQTIMTYYKSYLKKTPMKTDKWEMPLRFFFRYELEHLVERSYFRRYKIVGDFHGNELNRDSREFIVICQKV